ncbi:SMI1/KNR4 family protein [Actinoplanes flavus]|uniref:SMI1/KNR4 family protein n=1 Tax=Actinoplanes flavus TaxID=2820290 RepID=A0ABS3UVN6_9ACTN|nr:SMI1/KNR4 family protein [Actinoplanes flavus]MBO3742602.1 SMI1/KNR4 family protein [Actinoplanes flavus]
MNRGWTGRGPWMIAATSAGADWRIALAGLAAATEAPVAAVVIGTSVPDDDPARPFLAGVLEVAGTARLPLDRVRDLAEGMSRSYELVLVAADAGLLLPVGEGGWTLVDLAVAMGAPVVVVTGPGPDAAHHTSLVVDALHGRNLSAAVVTVGDVDESALPLPPAGRIPAAALSATPGSAATDDPGSPPETIPGAAETPSEDGRFAGAAEWFEPMLRVEPQPATPVLDVTEGARKPVSGKRFVLGLLGVFVIMVLMACGLGWCGSEPIYSAHIDYTGPVEPTVRPYTPHPSTYVPPSRPRPPSTAACPENAGAITPTRPDAATTQRVNRAWQRIEKWLAANAPASARGPRPPAGAKRIDELQRRMSVAFPADLVASLRRHDGVRPEARFDLPPFFLPQSLDEILGDWRSTCTVLAGDAGSWPGEDWWHRQFVPFASAGDGGCLLVDQRPGGHGRVGEFYPEDGTDFARWPASVTELLEGTATALETGRPYDGRYRPTVTGDGLLDWEII